MRTGFKRFLSSFIVVVMIMALLPAISFAVEGDTPYTDFEYTKSTTNKTITLKAYKGTATDVVVPGSYVIDGVTYTTYITSSVTFTANTTIKSVTLKSGVKFKSNKMDYLFADCTALASVDMTQVSTASVTTMAAAFKNCTALKTLNVSNFNTSKVTSFCNMFCGAKYIVITGLENWNTSKVTDMSYMFYGGCASSQILDFSKWDLSNVTTTYATFTTCPAKNIVLPSSLPIISAFAFDHATGYNKASFTIPKGTKQIGFAHAIYDFATNNFKEFVVEEGSEYFKAVDGVLYSKDGTDLIAVPRAKTFPNNTFVIPEGVTFLPELSFTRNQKISTLVIPDSYVIRQSVPASDPEYILSSDQYDAGNLNKGNSLSIAVYNQTTVANYEVKESNKRYKSDRGIIYSKDMDKLLAVPLKYNKEIIVPEGVTRWEENAMYVYGKPQAPSSVNVKIPASLTYIGYEQTKMLNLLKKDKGWTFEIDENNPTYKLDANGYIVQYDLSEPRISLSVSSYAYDGTAKKPTVTVSLASGTTSLSTKTLKNGTDYTVEYINNVNAGKAQVKITGIGSYSRVITKDFYIESATPYTDFTYTLDSTAKTITLGKYNGTATTVVVPGTYTVSGTLYTTVIDSAKTFNSNTSIKSVTLCNGVKFKDNKMDYLFLGCSALTHLDLSRLSTSGVTSMYAVFNRCTALTNLDLSKFDTSKVTTFYAMFTCTNKLTITGYENWDTRALTNITYMFNEGLANQKLDLSAWNFRNVTETDDAFLLCGADSVVLPNALSLLTVTNKNNSVPNYEVDDENIYYSSDNGIVYSDDMSEILAVPFKYNKDMVIPEGVKRWAANAFDTTKQAEATTSHKIIIPASMTYIDNSQLALINYLKGSKSWKIEVDKNNPVFKVDSNGYLVQKGISDLRVTLSATSFTYDGTEKKPTVTVTATTGTTTVSQKTLTNGTDYIVEYLDNINAGTGKVKITGKGSYSGIVYKPFTITSSTTPAKQFKYTKTTNDIAVELPTSLVSGINDIEKIQIIVAYYDKETNAFLRMEKKTVRALTGDIIESFKLANDGEYAKVYVWNGDIPEVKPAYTYLTVE